MLGRTRRNQHTAGEPDSRALDEGAGQTISDAAGCPSCGRVSKVIVLGAGEGGLRG